MECHAAWSQSGFRTPLQLDQASPGATPPSQLDLGLCPAVMSAESAWCPGPSSLRLPAGHVCSGGVDSWQVRDGCEPRRVGNIRSVPGVRFSVEQFSDSDPACRCGEPGCESSIHRAIVNGRQVNSWDGTYTRGPIADWIEHQPTRCWHVMTDLDVVVFGSPTVEQYGTYRCDSDGCDKFVHVDSLTCVGLYCDQHPDAALLVACADHASTPGK